MNNYYIELSLDETLNSAELRDKLQIQRYQWEARASRAGSGSEKAKRKIEVIDEALQVFEDDDKRDAYDIELLRARKHDAGDKAEVDWLDRAWSYYFMGEYGPAEIAARNARSSAAQSPSPYVVSAWIEIALYEAIQGDGSKSDSKRSQRRKNARAYADEALVLDELSEDTAEVHHVRGVVFELERSMDKALRSYARALKTAEGAEKSVIQWRIMRVQLSVNHVKDACESASKVLAGIRDVAPDQKSVFISDCRKVFDAYASNFEKLNYLTALFGGDSLPDGVKEELVGHFDEVRRRLNAQSEIQDRKIHKLEQKKVLEGRLDEARRLHEAIPKSRGDFLEVFGLEGILVPVSFAALFILAAFGSEGSDAFLMFVCSLGCFGFIVVGLVMSAKGKALDKRRASSSASIDHIVGELRRLDGEIGDIEAEYRRVSLG